MPFVPFHDRFPDVAEREARSVHVIDDPGGVPAGNYLLVESYCDDAGCDCRRVLLNVFSIERRRVEAVINFGWESRDFYARWLGGLDDPEFLHAIQGPCLNVGSPASRHAPAILQLVNEMTLADREYIERLKRHYRMFRETVDGPKRNSRWLKRRRKAGS